MQTLKNLINIPFEFVFIDFDGTLAEIQFKDFEIFRQKLAENIYKIFGIKIPLKPLLESIFMLKNINEKAFHYALNCLDENEQESEVIIYQYTAQLISDLSKFPIAIVTNNCKPIVERTFDKLNFYNNINCIEGRSADNEYKPNTQMLLSALFAMDIKPETCNNFLMIGDSWRDAEAANNLSKITKGSYTFLNIKNIK